MLTNKQLKRGMFLYVDGPKKGEALIVIDWNTETVFTLNLMYEETINMTFSMENFMLMTDREIIEWACQLPKDVFSNMKNTWKKNNEK